MYVTHSWVHLPVYFYDDLIYYHTSKRLPGSVVTLVTRKIIWQPCTSLEIGSIWLVKSVNDFDIFSNISVQITFYYQFTQPKCWVCSSVSTFTLNTKSGYRSPPKTTRKIYPRLPCATSPAQDFRRKIYLPSSPPSTSRAWPIKGQNRKRLQQMVTLTVTLAVRRQT